MKKFTITEEIERIKNINKVISELDYSDSDPRSHGSYGYQRGRGFNPNSDYLSDIGARKAKERTNRQSSVEYDQNGNPINKKKPEPPKILDINNKEDRILLIKKILTYSKNKYYKIKSATPETIKIIDNIFPNQFYHGLDTDHAHLHGNRDFDLEIIYFLLKNGRFYTTSDRIEWSSTFMNLISDSTVQPGHYQFKDGVNLSLEEFVDFVKNNYNKIEDESLNKFSKRLEIARKKRKNKM